MFREAYIYNINTTLAAGTGLVFSELRLQMNNFDFEFKRTSHIATDNRIYKKIFDNATGRYLYKTYDDLRSVSGVALSGITTNGFLPYNWPIPYRAKAQTIMSIFLSDFANNGNNVLDLTYHGDALKENAPIDMQGKQVDYNEKRRCVPIIYEAPAIATLAGVGKQNQGLLTIDNDSDFVCTRITGISTAAQYITIHDLARDEYWQNQKTHVNNLIGNGQFPNVLTSPRFICKNSRLLITAENNDAGANSITLYFHGYKRY